MKLIIIVSMKKHIPLLLLLAAALSGCQSIYVPTLTEVPLYPGNSHSQQVSSDSFSLSPTHWGDVAKIHEEATRLSYQVSQGKMTKVQAAQYLNRYRIQLIGRNNVDDNMYEVYLRSAVDSQRGVIDTNQSKRNIKEALKGWQKRWKNMNVKPNNPAFTNFLLEHMDMAPLK